MKYNVPTNKIFLMFCMLSMILAVIMFGYGCSSFSTALEKTKNISPNFASSKNSLKKKVGIVNFQNDSGVEDDKLVGFLWSGLTTNMVSGYSDTISIITSENQNAEFLSNPEKKSRGLIDNSVLSKKGREIGLSEIVVPTLTYIGHEEKHSKFMWFKEDFDLIRISMDIEVYDTYTGAKILYEKFNQEIEVEPLGANPILEKNVLSIEKVNKNLSRTLKKIAKTTGESIASQPWKGYVVSATEDRAELSSGSDIGIKVGDVFDVYGIHGTLHGIEGNQFVIPGSQSDELKIISVTSNTAEGVSLSGNPIPVGSLVQMKKK